MTESTGETPEIQVLQTGWKVERKRLGRALTLKAQKEGPGIYLVEHLDPRERESRSDLEPEWVNLVDQDVQPCNCEDFTFRGDFHMMPCKHILAAMLADGHRDVTRIKREWFPDTETAEERTIRATGQCEACGHAGLVKSGESWFCAECGTEGSGPDAVQT